MDTRLIGKWYAGESNETINIFGEMPLRMKISFPDTGFYHFEPNCVYEKDGYLCYEINDEHYRMVYHVQFADGRLEGFFTQHGKSHPIQYVKMDDVPEDVPYRYVPTTIYVPKSEESSMKLLQQHAAYDRSREQRIHDHFVLGGEVPDILEKYHYSEYVKDLDASKDELVFRLLDFVCDHFGHNGSDGMGSGRNIIDLIAFCEQHDQKTNCRGLAILLASLLRLNGIKARHITCMPHEDPFEDCHVVVDCLLPSGKRAMLDPTWRLYLKDKDGEYVSLPHLRELLLADEPLFENPTAGYNGTSFDKAYHREYMTKNTFRFARCTCHMDGVDGRLKDYPYIELIPSGYPEEKFPQDVQANFIHNDIEFWRM